MALQAILQEVPDTFIRFLARLLVGIRKAVGPHVGLALDLNFNFKAEAARRICRVLEPMGMMWVELDMYSAAGGIAQAIRSVGGNVSDQQAFITAMRTEKLTTPMGVQTLDSHGNPVFDVYIRKVEQGPHGLWNVPVQTYHAVTQFWTYDPQAFLNHPVYSKSYQGNGVWPDPAS